MAQGMYPTALVLLVSLTNFTVESATNLENMTAPSIKSLQPNMFCKTTQSNINVVDSTGLVITGNGNSDPYIQSVIAILGDGSSMGEETSGAR